MLWIAFYCQISVAFGAGKDGKNFLDVHTNFFGGLVRTIDLHCHSTFSDGTDSPTDLVVRAKHCGLSCIALTDHDTCAGLAEAEDAGREHGLHVIRGVEVSTRLPDLGELHILGLWVPKGDAALDEKIAMLRAWRKERNAAILERLCRLGLSLTMDDVMAFAGQGALGRPHFALALVHKGYVPTLALAFARYLGSGCPAYVPKRVFSPEETVAMLARAKATVVLAHPMLHHYPHDRLFACIRDLVPFGLDAIEAWHTEHSPGDTALCRSWASQLGLGVSGGSDYHGRNKPGVELGHGRHNLCLMGEILDALLARRISQGRPV